MNLWYRILTLLVILASADIALRADDSHPLANQVVVVANKAVSGSLNVANHYMAARGIPENNLVILDAPDTEKISREDFIQTIHNPLLHKLNDQGLADLMISSEDGIGRLKVMLPNLKFQYLVLCYGIPVKITNGTVDGDSERRQAWFRNKEELAKRFENGPLAKSAASVDGELALLFKNNVPHAGFIPNPYHQVRARGRLDNIIKVTRLDGPDASSVRNMIDQAILGERKGLRGRAYIDEDSREGGFAIGNKWLENVAILWERLGFPLSRDQNRSLFPVTHRFDYPVLYAGWYAGNVSPPFNFPGFRFPPGAIAVHLHSFSADPLRHPGKRWVGPFVDRGVSATLGNTSEPYLNLTHHLNAFFVALAEGWNFADAAYFALPGLSWQAVAIGDPLFHPFKKDIDEQMENTGEAVDVFLDQYVILRKMNLLPPEEALKLARRGHYDTPGPALAYALARLEHENGDTDKARRTMEQFQAFDAGDPSEWGLFAEVAAWVAEWGEAGSATTLYEKLFSQPLPDKFKEKILPGAINAARAADNDELRNRWSEMKAALDKAREEAREKARAREKEAAEKAQNN